MRNPTPAISTRFSISPRAHTVGRCHGRGTGEEFSPLTAVSCASKGGLDTRRRSRLLRLDRQRADVAEISRTALTPAAAALSPKPANSNVRLMVSTKVSP